MRLRNDRREERRREAQERVAGWVALSTPDKIKELQARRGASKRQLKKLLELAAKTVS